MFAIITKLFMPPFNTMGQPSGDDSLSSEADSITGPFFGIAQSNPRACGVGVMLWSAGAYLLNDGATAGMRRACMRGGGLSKRVRGGKQREPCVASACSNEWVGKRAPCVVLWQKLA